VFRSSFVFNQLQRDRFSRIGNFFCVIAIKQKQDNGDVSDERLFCGDRRRKGRRFESRDKREGMIMLDEMLGGIDSRHPWRSPFGRLRRPKSLPAIL
jgi:hypothetical protein